LKAFSVIQTLPARNFTGFVLILKLLVLYFTAIARYEVHVSFFGRTSSLIK